MSILTILNPVTSHRVAEIVISVLSSIVPLAMIIGSVLLFINIIRKKRDSKKRLNDIDDDLDDIKKENT